MFNILQNKMKYQKVSEYFYQNFHILSDNLTKNIIFILSVFKISFMQIMQAMEIWTSIPSQTFLPVNKSSFKFQKWFFYE